jgi:hypothetical protein
MTAGGVLCTSGLWWWKSENVVDHVQFPKVAPVTIGTRLVVDDSMIADEILSSFYDHYSLKTHMRGRLK